MNVKSLYDKKGPVGSQLDKFGRSIINYISSVISGKYCNFMGLQECDLSINRTLCEL